MNTTELLKQLPELRERYGHTDFPFGRFSDLANELRSLKHLYVISEKINKGDRATLKTLDKNSQAYLRRNSLLSQDSINQSLRMAQIEGMQSELDALSSKLNELIEYN